MNLDEKIRKVEEILKDKNIAIAFSGGSDSTLLAKLAMKVSNKAIAITVDNGLMPQDFIQKSSKIAENIGIEQKILKTNMLNLNGFKENNKNRCYICRQNMYGEIINFAEENNDYTVIDGNNISDFLEDRPGILVKFEKNILSPLIDAEIEDKDVINYLNKENIEYNKSTTCLATRIKTNTPITRKNINRINYCENLIKNMARQDYVKVRDIGNDTAVIELSNLENVLNMNQIKLISSELKAVNFKKILLNIDSKKVTKELVVYKPCKDVAGKTMIENELPYHINLDNSLPQLKELGECKYSDKIGVIMLEYNNKNISIFENGKISIRRTDNLEDGKNTFIKILPMLRRKL